jgi:hypothetical protein
MPSLPNPGADPTKLNFGNPPELNVAFAAEMEKLLAKYPTDLDVAAVYVEGVMNIKPWALWDRNVRHGTWLSLCTPSWRGSAGWRTTI